MREDNHPRCWKAVVLVVSFELTRHVRVNGVLCSLWAHPSRAIAKPYLNKSRKDCQTSYILHQACIMRHGQASERLPVRLY